MWQWWLDLVYPWGKIARLEREHAEWTRQVLEKARVANASLKQMADSLDNSVAEAVGRFGEYRLVAEAGLLAIVVSCGNDVFVPNEVLDLFATGVGRFVMKYEPAKEGVRMSVIHVPDDYDAGELS